MPEISISEAQREYLDSLRERLAAEHVGEYGHVRPRDALQFLIDRHEADGSGAVPATDDSTEAAADGDDGGTEDGGADGTPDAESGPERVRAMMNLLEEHDDKWEEADAEDGKYVVTLPEGGRETVRTKDDVRAVLFQHYR